MSDARTSDARIEVIRWGTRRCALRRPYQLAFGRLTEFPSSWIEVIDERGCGGIGEAVALPGYGDETTAMVEAVLADFAAAGPGLTRFEAERRARARSADAPFAASAILTALQMPRWLDGTACEAPLNVAVDPEADAQPAEARGWTDAGFAHLKVKVGRDLDRDCRLARRLLDAPRLPARLAFDANQGFTVDEARRFADALAIDPHRRVQWFEQPVDRHDWSGLEAVCRGAPVPVVIDESIGGLPDIERARAIGAAGVKLKLCKHGGPDELARLLDAVPRELRVVLGNGVATDITNAIELRVWHASGRCVAPAECSGFARLREPMYFDGLTVEGGRARLAAGSVPAGRRRPMEGR